jgi:cob(I)alamin adenosyltransferase
MRLNQGLIQVYTGNGKGKTTAALGLALRAIGWNFRVCVIQFIKGNQKIGEMQIAKKLKNNLEIYQFFEDTKYAVAKPDQKYQASVTLAWEFFNKILAEKKYDIIILDEINNAIKYKLLNVDEVIKILKNKPKNIELILTGRDAPKKIIEIADLVTEMKLIKHPFYKKIKARKGIEY